MLLRRLLLAVAIALAGCQWSPQRVSALSFDVDIDSVHVVDAAKELAASMELLGDDLPAPFAAQLASLNDALTAMGDGVEAVSSEALEDLFFQVSHIRQDLHLAGHNVPQSLMPLATKAEDRAKQLLEAVPKAAAVVAEAVTESASELGKNVTSTVKQALRAMMGSVGVAYNDFTGVLAVFAALLVTSFGSNAIYKQAKDKDGKGIVKSTEQLQPSGSDNVPESKNTKTSAAPSGDAGDYSTSGTANNSAGTRGRTRDRNGARRRRRGATPQLHASRKKAVVSELASLPPRGRGITGLPPVAITQIALGAFLLIDFFGIIVVPGKLLLAVTVLLTGAVPLLPFETKPTASWSSVAAFVAAVAFAVYVSQPTACVDSFTRLRLAKVVGDKVVPDEAGLSRLVQIAATAGGGILVASRNGPVDTGKSVATTLDARLLLSGAASGMCPLDSDARAFQPKDGVDEDSNFNSTEGNEEATGEPNYNDESYCGKTQGINSLVIRVSDLQIDPSLSHLTSVVSHLPQDATLVLMDVAGSGGLCPQDDARIIKMLQVISMSMSSYTNFHVEAKLKKWDLDSLVTVAHMKMASARAEVEGCLQSTPQPGIEEPGVTETAKPQITITIVKDTKRYMGGRTGVHRSHGGGFIDAMDPTIDLDVTANMQLFRAGLTPDEQKQFAALESAADLSLLATVPASTRPKLLSRSGLAELEFLDALDTTPGLPHLDEPGLTRGMALFNLPYMLQHLELVTTSSGQPASPEEFAEEFRQVIADVHEVPEHCLRSAQSSQCDDFLCSAAERTQRKILAKIKDQFLKVMPFEAPEGPCEAAVACPRSEFDAQFNAAIDAVADSQSICRNVRMMLNPDACVAKLSKQRKAVYDELWEINQKKCTYVWHTTSTENVPCQGTCPGYKPRTVECRNSKGERRDDRCCSGLPDGKPPATENCTMWHYKWMTDPWSDCSGQCGTKTRNVWCRRCDSEPVDENFCHVDTVRAGPKPNNTTDCDSTHVWKSDGMGPWDGPGDDLGDCGTRRPLNLRCEVSCAGKERVVDASKCARALNPKPQSEHRGCRRKKCECAGGWAGAIFSLGISCAFPDCWWE